MRIEIAVLFGGCVALTGGAAWAQTPPPEPATPGPDSPVAPVSSVTAPAASVAPPSTSVPPVTPFVPPAATADPALSQPPPSPALIGRATPGPTPAEPMPEKPLHLAGRFGFGFGIWAAPAGLAGQGGAGASAGGSLGVRFWVNEKLLLVPVLRMGISSTSAPDERVYSLEPIRGATFTDGHFSPGLSLGFAAYRGKSSRFILLGGVAFSYTVSHVVMPTRLPDNGVGFQYLPVETVSLDVPVGFSFEQFFTPKISISLGAGAPLFSYGTTRTGHDAPSRFIGADFSTAQLTGAVFFYTD